MTISTLGTALLVVAGVPVVLALGALAYVAVTEVRKNLKKKQEYADRWKN